MSVRERLEAAIAAGQSARAIALRAGISETAMSLYRSDKYPAGTARVEARIAEALAQVECPFLGRHIAQSDCRSFACRDVPTENPLALQHWSACQRCPYRPGPLPARAPARGGGPPPATDAVFQPLPEPTHALPLYKNS